MNRKSKEIGKVHSEKVFNHKKSIETFEKNRLKIVKKAMRLFIKKGYAQSSMREISQVTGIASAEIALLVLLPIRVNSEVPLCL